MKKIIAAAIAVLLLPACASYEKLVRDNLKIPFVFQPPNDASHPYTLFMYTDAGNFQAVCDATRTTGLSNDEILALRVANTTSSFGIGSTESVSLKAGLSQGEIGSADASFARINRVELTLENGRAYSLPTLSIAEILDNIENGRCVDDARIYLRENPKARFALPTTVYGYDLKYRILTTDGANVTAELPAHLRRLVLDKAGLGGVRFKTIEMDGDGLYVGFRGTNIDRTLASALGRTKPLVAALASAAPVPQRGSPAPPDAASASPGAAGDTTPVPPHASAVPPIAPPAPPPSSPIRPVRAEPALVDKLIDVTDLVRGDN